MLKEGESFVYTACPGWGDHDYCALKTIVKDGKIVRTEAVEYFGPEAADGHICQKGCLSCRQPYDPKRLKKPGLTRLGISVNSRDFRSSAKNISRIRTATASS